MGLGKRTVQRFRNVFSSKEGSKIMAERAQDTGFYRDPRNPNRYGMGVNTGIPGMKFEGQTAAEDSELSSMAETEAGEDETPKFKGAGMVDIGEIIEAMTSDNPKEALTGILRKLGAGPTCPATAALGHFSGGMVLESLQKGMAVAVQAGDFGTATACAIAGQTVADLINTSMGFALADMPEGNEIEQLDFATLHDLISLYNPAAYGCEHFAALKSNSGLPEEFFEELSRNLKLAVSGMNDSRDIMDESPSFGGTFKR